MLRDFALDGIRRGGVQFTEYGADVMLTVADNQTLTIRLGEIGQHDRYLTLKITENLT